MMPAFVAASPPRRSTTAARAIPRSSGSNRSDHDLPLHHRPHRGRRRGGQLVQPVVTAEHECRGSPAGKDGGHHRRKPLVGHPHSLRGGLRGVRQWPEDVEHGRHPDLPASGRRVPQCRVKDRRETEPDACLPHAGGHIVGPQVHHDAERLQQVGRSAGRRRRPVAVLDDGPAGAGDDQRGQGGQVDGVRPVATRAAGVHALSARSQAAGAAPPPAPP